MSRGRLKLELPHRGRSAVLCATIVGYVFLLVGLTQVFSEWLPIDVLHPVLYRHRLALLSFALVFGFAGYGGTRLLRWRHQRIGWCRTQARELHRQYLGLSAAGFSAWEARRRLRSVLSQMARPTPYAVVPLALASALVALLFVVGARLDPTTEIPAAYFTVWQMQLAWGGAALPILIFIIEFSDRRPGTVQALPDVLTRHSLVLPILGVTLGLVIALGIGSYWFSSGWSYPIAFLTFTVSAALTAWAFFRLALLLYDRRALRERSTELLLERFQDELTDRLRFQLRSLVLQRWIASQRRVAIADRPQSGIEREGRGVRAPDGAHQVLDVNLSLLGALARQLDAASAQASSATESETSIKLGGEALALVVLDKMPGEIVGESDLLATVSETVPEALFSDIRDALWSVYRFKLRQAKE